MEILLLDEEGNYTPLTDRELQILHAALFAYPQTYLARREADRARAPSATGYDWQTENALRAIVTLRAKLPAPPR